ncbi:hypothetical protein RB195_017244 [Necator americanus]|uniref:G-protein coupled receptors family 1 profile domain-containing protein n=1 Tax=Necator americanus TaxID=51031 RepID=A0ABR1C6W0_NECAM
MPRIPFLYSLEEFNMVSCEFLVDTVMSAFTLVTAVLYIRVLIALHRIIKRAPEEKLTAYFYFLFLFGFVNLLVIANQIFFQIPQISAWQLFLHRLGAMGARTHIMIYLGTEVFIVLCVAFTAILRYLTFIHQDTACKYWNIRRVRKWTFLIAVTSSAYASIYFFCNFRTDWFPSKRRVRFLFADESITWVGVSIFIPFTLATIALLLYVYCYWRVVKIITDTHTGLRASTTVKMFLSSTVITSGAYLSVLVRMVNHMSRLIQQHGVLSPTLSSTLVKMGILISSCSNPWILISLYPAIREETFPCLRKKSKSAENTSTKGDGNMVMINS